MDVEKPELYLHGKETYRVNINPESATGTLASLEYALRRLDRLAEDEARLIERREKNWLIIGNSRDGHLSMGNACASF